MTNANRARLAAALVSCLCAGAALADSTAQTLPFSQDWATDGITANDDWSGVAGIQGFLGSDITASTGIDPQTLLAADSPGTVDVIANITAPNSSSSGGVGEIAITDRVIALQGSGTADAPYFKIYLDTTGESDITVSYTLRDVDGSTDNAVQPVALQYRIGDSGDFTNVAGAYVADATTGPSLATAETDVSVELPDEVEGQSLVELRFITSNAVGNDEWVGIDDILIEGSGAPPALSLSVEDAAWDELDDGQNARVVNVSLNGVAPAGGVTFDYATSDGTATAPGDYEERSFTGITIPEGESFVGLVMVVNGDTDVEDDETFLVDVTNVVGAVVADGQATATITNDDFDVLEVHEIQGPTGLSPYDGDSVVVRAIVTAIRWNGFQLQTPDADVDADPTTSEGIFVYTGNASPLLTTLQVGDDVQLTATVDEYTPSARPHQLSLTELTGPTGVTVLSSGNPLPAPIALSASATSVDEFEKYEGMRVSLPDVTAVSPVEGSIDENDAVGTAYGTFYGVIGDTARPFREEGLSVLDVTPVPGGVTPPTFDNNPERIRIVNDQEGATAIAVDVGAVVSGITGVMDYDYAIYSVLPDPGASVNVTGGMTATGTTAPAYGEVTIAGFNMLHFYDTVDDSGGDVVLTPAAFEIRKEKAARAICISLNTPDIVGAVEVENLAALQAIATAINDDTYGVCPEDPQYVAYLELGNDVSNINIGYLVKTAEIAEGVARVEVQAVTQIGKDETFTNPSLTTSTLFDRPPLVLEAIVNNVDGSEYPITVIGNHLLSLTSVSSLSAGTNGWTTAGERARAKRGYQAARTAEIVEDMQDADPTRHIVLLGDFNAFEFNDGYVDTMGVVTGLEADATEVLRYVDSPLTTPLVNMTTLVDADHRYSYSFDGNAQVLDHIVVNQALLDDVPAVRTEHPRINADFGIDHYGDSETPLRVSDHDPVLLYIPLDVGTITDLGVDVTADVGSADAAATIGFSVALDNSAMTADDVLVTLVSSVATSTFDVTAPTGFDCVAVDETTVECAADSFAVGSDSFAVDLVASAYLPGSVTLTATASTSSDDGNAGNDSDADTTALTVMSTDMAVTRLPPVSYLVVGPSATANFQVANVSGNPAYSPRLNIRITAKNADVVPTEPADWQCNELIGGPGPVDPRVAYWQCAFTGAYAAGRSDTIGLTITPPTSMAVTIDAATFTQNPDTNRVNNRATASFSVIKTP
jgi:predicted extracellular nuclease